MTDSVSWRLLIFGCGLAAGLLGPAGLRAQEPQASTVPEREAAARVEVHLVGAVGHNPELAQLIHFAWLGICVYTWVGPGLFRRSLEREISSVVLKQDF